MASDDARVDDSMHTRRRNRWTANPCIQSLGSGSGRRGKHFYIGRDARTEREREMLVLREKEREIERGQDGCVCTCAVCSCVQCAGTRPTGMASQTHGLTGCHAGGKGFEQDRTG
ncbi:hypothetical protein K504DRAFT_190171 [Pleomassaria siparia CBS 279.74]|uniref:Uncharacterized protein n=1 Tax=Pleomassaria siparia CBS 279.74 TaxID=1314801 RepID=A0A6G1JQN2_9PLEO|nr:hypothetical protein K504DRAFT_190171 [Pleomassaria siparia CBS 279.74]